MFTALEAVKMEKTYLSKNKKSTFIVVNLDRQIAIGAYNLFLQAAQKGELSPAACKKAGLSNEKIKSLQLVARKANKDAKKEKIETAVNIETLKEIVGKKVLKLEEFQDVVNGVIETPTKLDMRTRIGKLISGIKTAAIETAKRLAAFAAKKLYRQLAILRGKTHGWSLSYDQDYLLWLHGEDIDSLMLECLSTMGKIGLSLFIGSAKAKTSKQIEKAKADSILKDTIELNKFKLSFIGLNV